MKILCILLFVVSCNYKTNKEKSIPPLAPSTEISETVSYNQLKEEVLIPKCISCHGNAGGVNLESYDLTHKHLHSIERATLQVKTMPKSPVPPLNHRQLEILTAWVEAGGPDKPTGHQGPEEEEDGPQSLGFNMIKTKILEVKCLSCHRVGEHAGHIPLETKEDLISSGRMLVVPGEPDKSLIYTITAPGVRNMMPPYGVEPLTKVQRKMLEQWISKGAQ